MNIEGIYYEHDTPLSLRIHVVLIANMLSSLLFEWNSSAIRLWRMMEKCNGVQTGERTIATTFLSFVVFPEHHFDLSVHSIGCVPTVACKQRRWNGMCERGWMITCAMEIGIRSCGRVLLLWFSLQPSSLCFYFFFDFERADGYLSHQN